MRVALTMLAGLVAAFALVVSVQAEDKQDEVKTLKGTITCAKCDLKLEKKCATVIKVKQGDKDVVYYFDPASDRKYHKKSCTTPTKGTVKGTVKKEGDKNIVTVKEVSFE